MTRGGCEADEVSCHGDIDEVDVGCKSEERVI